MSVISVDLLRDSLRFYINDPVKTIKYSNDYIKMMNNDYPNLFQKHSSTSSGAKDVRNSTINTAMDILNTNEIPISLFTPEFILQINGINQAFKTENVNNCKINGIKIGAIVYNKLSTAPNQAIPVTQEVQLAGAGNKGKGNKSKGKKSTLPESKQQVNAQQIDSIITKIKELFTSEDKAYLNIEKIKDVVKEIPLEWIQDNISSDIQNTDILLCLIDKKAYFSILYFFLYREDVNGNIKFDFTKVNDGKLNENILDNLENSKDIGFTLDARQSLTVQRFTKFNRDANNKIIDKACFLFHGVGTGKTLTSLSMMITHIDTNKHTTEDQALTCIVIAPEGLFQAAFLGDDAKLIGIYIYNITVQQLDGTDANQNLYIETAIGAIKINDTICYIKFVGYNYNALVSKQSGDFENNYLLQHLDTENGLVLICDEAHRIVLRDKSKNLYKNKISYRAFPPHDAGSKDEKGPEADNIIKTYRFLEFSHKFDQCIFLTGTPIQKDIQDMIDICLFLNVKIHNVKVDGKYKDEYINTSNKDNFKDVTDMTGALDQIFYTKRGLGLNTKVLTDMVNITSYMFGIYNKYDSGITAEVMASLKRSCVYVSICGLLLGRFFINDQLNAESIFTTVVAYYFGTTIDNFFKKHVFDYQINEKVNILVKGNIGQGRIINKWTENGKKWYEVRISGANGEKSGTFNYPFEDINPHKLGGGDDIIKDFINDTARIKDMKDYIETELFITKNGYEEKDKERSKDLIPIINSYLEVLINIHVFNQNPTVKYMRKIDNLLNNEFKESHLEFYKSINSSATGINELRDYYIKNFEDIYDKEISKIRTSIQMLTILNGTFENTFDLKNTFEKDLEEYITQRITELKTENPQLIDAMEKEEEKEEEEEEYPSSSTVPSSKKSKKMDAVPPSLLRNIYARRPTLGNMTANMTKPVEIYGGDITKLPAQFIRVIKWFSGFIKEFLTLMYYDLIASLKNIGPILPGVSGILTRAYEWVQLLGVFWGYIFNGRATDADRDLVNKLFFTPAAKPDEWMYPFVGSIATTISSVLEVADFVPHYNTNEALKATMTEIQNNLRYILSSTLKPMIGSGIQVELRKWLGITLNGIAEYIWMIVDSLTDYLWSVNMPALITHTEKYISIYNYDYNHAAIDKFPYGQTISEAGFPITGTTNAFPRKNVMYFLTPFREAEEKVATSKKTSIDNDILKYLETRNKLKENKNNDEIESLEKDFGKASEDITKEKLLEEYKKLTQSDINNLGCGILEPRKEKTPTGALNKDFDENHQNDEQMIQVVNSFEFEILDNERKINNIPTDLMHFFNNNNNNHKNYYSNITNNLPKNSDKIKTDLFDIKEPNTQLRFNIILNLLKLARCGVVYKNSNLHLHPHYYINDKNKNNNTLQYFLPIIYPTTEEIMFSFCDFLDSEGFTYLHMTGTAKEIQNIFNIGSKTTFPIAKFGDTNNTNPICVIIKPEHMEGFSFIFNPILCAPALCNTSGDTEQVYGRILRKYNERKKHIVLDKQNEGKKYDKMVYQFFGINEKDSKDKDGIKTAYVGNDANFSIHYAKDNILVTTKTEDSFFSFSFVKNTFLQQKKRYFKTLTWGQLVPTDIFLKANIFTNIDIDVKTDETEGSQRERQVQDMISNAPISDVTNLIPNLRDEDHIKQLYNVSSLSSQYFNSVLVKDFPKENPYPLDITLLADNVKENGEICHPPQTYKNINFTQKSIGTGYLCYQDNINYTSKPMDEPYDVEESALISDFEIEFKNIKKINSQQDKDNKLAVFEKELNKQGFTSIDKTQLTKQLQQPQKSSNYLMWGIPAVMAATAYYFGNKNGGRKTKRNRKKQTKNKNKKQKLHKTKRRRGKK